MDQKIQNIRGVEVVENVSNLISSITSDIFKINAILSNIEFIFQTDEDIEDHPFFKSYEPAKLEHRDMVRLSTAVKALMITSNRILSNWEN